MGINAGYSHSHQDQYTSDRQVEINSNSFFGSISLMKYFLYEKKVGIRTGPYAQYNVTKVKEVNTIDEFNSRIKADGYAGGIGLDFVYFPMKKFGLIASIGNLSYSKDTSDGLNNKTSQSGVSLSVFNNTSFSIFYALGK